MIFDLRFAVTRPSLSLRAFAVAAAVALMPLSSAAQNAGFTERIAPTFVSSFDVAFGLGKTHAISAEGRFVAFTSEAIDVVEGDTNVSSTSSFMTERPTAPRG